MNQSKALQDQADRQKDRDQQNQVVLTAMASGPVRAVSIDLPRPDKMDTLIRLEQAGKVKYNTIRKEWSKIVKQ